MNELAVNILLAEDDADDRMLFREAVQRTDRTVLLNECEDGDSAFELLVNGAILPDLIVLDINMPRVTGIECLKMIRADGRFAQLPVIILSTANDYKSITEARRAGASYYAIKPGSFKVLQQMTRFLIQRDWNSAQPDPEDFILNNLLATS